MNCIQRKKFVCCILAIEVIDCFDILEQNVNVDFGKMFGDTPHERKFRRRVGNKIIVIFVMVYGI